jgi:thiol:disulfide interchange protein DsbD
MALRLRILWAAVAVGLALLLPRLAAAAEDFLPPEQAFRFEARVLDARSVEVAFTVAEGYYLYREPFKFVADGATLGPPAIPPGKVKFDETFQKDVETYRGRVAIRIPVTDARPSFALRVTSQGCADAGLCYPPMQSVARVSLAGFGGNGSVVAGTSGGGTSAEGALAGGAGATSATPSGSGDDGIDAALRGGRLGVVVLAFLAAGVLLSLTPCVLPMLPILSSIIVGQQRADGTTGRGRGIALAATYSFGMALVYTALGVAAGLAGEGLAATLQTPWVLGGFALLLGLLALSMFGAYELQLPAAWRETLSARSGRLQGGRWAGVFAMGGLSALIVSPCVAAPLAGALLYISQTRDVLLGGVALFSLAAGMSVPLLLVGASAGALMPRPGPWMEGVKRLFGVLLLAVAWWMLAPVLPPPVGVAGWGVLLLLAASLLRAFDRRSGSAVGAAPRLGQAAGLALALFGAAQIVGATAGASDPLQPLRPFTDRAAAPYGAAPAAWPANTGRAPATPSPRASSEAVAAPGDAPSAGRFRSVAGLSFRRVASVEELDAALREGGRPALLDFYADWCVSCKEMERFTFADPKVHERLGRALLLQADVTRNTEADRALLRRFSLFGPPGIVFFDAQGREQAAVRVIGYQAPARFLQSLDAAGL